MVDSFSCIKHNLLEHIWYNQKKLRIDLLSYVEDAYFRSDILGNHVGQMIILPSSATCIPINMMQNYQDSMAIFRVYWFPHLFIMFTLMLNGLR